MIMEFVGGGELFSHIARSAGALGEDEARKLFIDLMRGLKYCHDRKIAHRDLKPENLLIDVRSLPHIGHAHAHTHTHTHTHTYIHKPARASITRTSCAPEVLGLKRVRSLAPLFRSPHSLHSFVGLRSPYSFRSQADGTLKIADFGVAFNPHTAGDEGDLEEETTGGIPREEGVAEDELSGSADDTLLAHTLVGSRYGGGCRGGGA